MEIPFFELRKMLEAAAEIGAMNFAVKHGIISPTISQAEAYRKYGRGKVQRWKKEGLIKAEQDGPNTVIRYSVAKLETVALSSNRISFAKYHTA